MRARVLIQIMDLLHTEKELVRPIVIMNVANREARASAKTRELAELALALLTL